MMKKQDGLGSDSIRSRHPEEEMFTRNLAVFLFVSLLLAAVMLAAPIASPAQVSVGVSVAFGPPALPLYVQPLCPGPDFIWIPGYWAWDPDFGYYWVPGMWALAPFVGVLWTPGYWAWSNGVFIWYEGYWGPVVGYYGGINYGYGYTGYGYVGGYWSGNRFYYNRTVNNVSGTNITTVYSGRAGTVRPAGASFNGGPGGIVARPTSEQLAAARHQRASLTSAQKQQLQVARDDPKQRATINHGRPAVAATAKPGAFTGRGVISASRAGAPYKALPGRKAAPNAGVRTPRHSAAMRPPVTAPGRQRLNEPRQRRRAPVTAPEGMAPGTPRRGPEQRFSEPGPAPQPGLARPMPPKKETEGEREGPR